MPRLSGEVRGDQVGRDWNRHEEPPAELTDMLWGGGGGQLIHTETLSASPPGMLQVAMGSTMTLGKQQPCSFQNPTGNV